MHTAETAGRVDGDLGRRRRADGVRTAVSAAVRRLQRAGVARLVLHVHAVRLEVVSVTARLDRRGGSGGSGGGIIHERLSGHHSRWLVLGVLVADTATHISFAWCHTKSAIKSGLSRRQKTVSTTSNELAVISQENLLRYQNNNIRYKFRGDTGGFRSDMLKSCNRRTAAQSTTKRRW